MKEKDCGFLFRLGLKPIETGGSSTAFPFKLNKATVKYPFV